MESQAIELLERQASALADYPEVQARVQEHLGETERQLERLEESLETLGEDTSVIKDTALSALGNFMAITNTMADDAILKNSFASYSFEHYEIAAYESLDRHRARLSGQRLGPLLTRSSPASALHVLAAVVWNRSLAPANRLCLSLLTARSRGLLEFHGVQPL